MPRPRRIGRIFFDPEVTYFKPVGVPLRNLEETILTKEEVEAVRLIDLENQDQNKVAKKMKISQPTLSRLLTSARKKIADAIINGKSIKIQGGIYEMAIQRPLGRGLGRRRPAAGGRGRMGGAAAGPGGQCVCPKCGHKIKHQIGTPCYKTKCPKCNTQMTRA